MTEPRPVGFDYTIADEERLRCPECNLSGYNRTGLRPTMMYGATSTVFFAERCPLECNDGLKEE